MNLLRQVNGVGYRPHSRLASPGKETTSAGNLAELVETERLRHWGQVATGMDLD
jgi:hypothetical protein